MKRATQALAAALMAATLAAQAGPSKPFKASLELEHRVGRLTKCEGSEGQPGSGGTLAGTGHATHLGAVQVQGSHCLQGRQDDTVHVSNGQMRVVAANGDVMLVDYAGDFTPVAPGVYAFDGDYFIHGGSGRLQDAGGSGALAGSLSGPFSADPQPLHLTAEGRFSD